MNLDKRFAPLLNAILMAIVLPFFMTFALTLANTGLTNMLVQSWMRTWGIASVVAFPLILILAPMIRKIVARMTA